MIEGKEFRVKMIKGVMLETDCNNINICQEALDDALWNPLKAIKFIKNPQSWAIRKAELEGAYL